MSRTAVVQDETPTLRCARHPVPEVYPYPLSRAIVWLSALAPGLSDWLAFRAARRAGRI